MQCNVLASIDMDMWEVNAQVVYSRLDREEDLKPHEHGDEDVVFHHGLL